MKTSNLILLSTLVIVLGTIALALILIRPLIMSPLIKGDANPQTEVRAVEPFSRINVMGNFKVHYTQEVSHQLVVRADSNLLEHIETYVRGGELTIKQLNRMRSSNRIRIDVSSPEVDMIKASASARFIGMNELSSENLQLVGNAGSYTEISGTFGRLRIEQNAGGKTKINGVCEEVDINANAGGAVEAFGLVAQKAKAEANAGGAISIFTHELDANANAGGSVRYKGAPVVRRISTNAGGSVRAVD